MGIADLALDDRAADAAEVGVETAVEADLQDDRAWRTAASAWSIRPRSVSMGFSQKMCLPAAAAAWITSVWVSVGEHTTTASIPGSARSDGNRPCFGDLQVRRAVLGATGSLTSATRSRPPRADAAEMFGVDAPDASGADETQFEDSIFHDHQAPMDRR